jgi:hypothetical protein
MSEAAKTPYKPPVPELGPGQTSYTSITEKISGIVLTRNTPVAWFIFFAIGFLLLHGLMVGVPYLLFEGVGIWGLNNPVGWGWAIINFVWWIGIGHAGTLISAVLLLFRQKWRTSINRAAYGKALVSLLLALALPQFNGYVAAISQPIDVGCICRIDLFDCFPRILVRRFGSRFRQHARPHKKPYRPGYIWNALPRLARFSHPLGTL